MSIQNIFREFKTGNGEPLFVIIINGEYFFKGKDICDALEYENAPGAIRKHVPDKHKKKLCEMKVTRIWSL